MSEVKSKKTRKKADVVCKDEVLSEVSFSREGAGVASEPSIVQAIASSKTDGQVEQPRDRYLRMFKRLQLLNIGLTDYRQKEQLMGTIRREDIAKALEAPELEANQKLLRRASRYVYVNSGQYRQLVLYYASLMTLDFVVEPKMNQTKKLNKRMYELAYRQFVQMVESMHLKHELAKVLEVVYKEGVYYGYVHAYENGMFFQQLDPDYCRITYMDRGLYFFSFNLNYFHTYPERLMMYPPVFREGMERLKTKEKSKGSNWMMLESKQTICIKVDEANWYPCPPFVHLFDSVLNIRDFKLLDRAEAEIDNYKLIHQKIPMDVKEGLEDRMLLTDAFIHQFHESLSQAVPSQVGVVTSPMELADLSFDRDRVDRNKVSEVTSQFWSDSGVSQLLFSSNLKTTSTSLSKSIVVDEAIACKVLRQVERWVQFYLDERLGDPQFRVRFLHVSLFHRKEWLDAALKAGAFGSAERSMVNALLGHEPSHLTVGTFLENDVLELPKKQIPFASSHTQSTDGAGRKKADTLDEAGEATVESGGNDADARD